MTSPRMVPAPPPGFVDDPYPFYDALRQHAPVHPLQGVSSHSVLLTRYADVLAVYRSPAASSDIHTVRPASSPGAIPRRSRQVDTAAAVRWS